MESANEWLGPAGTVFPPRVSECVARERGGERRANGEIKGAGAIRLLTREGNNSPIIPAKP